MTGNNSNNNAMAHYAPYARNVFDADELDAECVCSLTWGEIVELLGALNIPVPATTPDNTNTISKLVVQHNKQRLMTVDIDPKLVEKVRQATSITTISDKYFTKLTDDQRLRICSDVGVAVHLDEKKHMATRIRDALHPELAAKDWPTTLASIVTRIKSTGSVTSIRKLLNNRSNKELADVCNKLGVAYDPKESKMKLAHRIAQRDGVPPVLQEINNTPRGVAMAIPISPASNEVHVKARIYDLRRELQTLEQQLLQNTHHHQYPH